MSRVQQFWDLEVTVTSAGGCVTSAVVISMDAFSSGNSDGKNHGHGGGRNTEEESHNVQKDDQETFAECDTASSSRSSDGNHVGHRDNQEESDKVQKDEQETIPERDISASSGNSDGKDHGGDRDIEEELQKDEQETAPELDTASSSGNPKGQEHVGDRDTKGKTDKVQKSAREVAKIIVDVPPALDEGSSSSDKDTEKETDVVQKNEQEAALEVAKIIAGSFCSQRDRPVLSKEDTMELARSREQMHEDYGKQMRLQSENVYEVSQSAHPRIGTSMDVSSGTSAGYWEQMNEKQRMQELIKELSAQFNAMMGYADLGKERDQSKGE